MHGAFAQDALAGQVTSVGVHQAATENRRLPKGILELDIMSQYHVILIVVIETLKAIIIDLRSQADT